MPRKPLRPCAIANCKNLVEKDGDIFCKEHKPQEEKKYDKFLRGYKHDKRYDARWNKISKLVLAKKVWCEECIKNENRLTKAELVHHIIPIEDGGKVYDESNLEVVCKKCHSKLHKNLHSSFHF